MEEEIHMITNEHSLVPTEKSLNYIVTETKKGHRILTFTSSKQSLEEPSAQIELLLESAQSTTVTQHV